jgi:DNA polymerase III delta prime subunit
MNVPLLILSGPPGVGKTTVSWEIFDQLIAEGHAPALADLDLLGASWPVPADDPYNDRLKALNLRTTWQNFSAAGARCLIAAGVVESRETLTLYSGAIPSARTTLCRLHAGNAELAGRIAGRGRERGSGVGRMIDRAVELSTQLVAANVDDIVVDTNNRTVAEVARQIRFDAGNWPGIVHDHE